MYAVFSRKEQMEVEIGVEVEALNFDEAQTKLSSEFMAIELVEVVDITEGWKPMFVHEGPIEYDGEKYKEVFVVTFQKPVEDYRILAAERSAYGSGR